MKAIAVILLGTLTLIGSNATAQQDLVANLTNTKREIQELNARKSRIDKILSTVQSQEEKAQLEAQSKEVNQRIMVAEAQLRTLQARYEKWLAQQEVARLWQQRRSDRQDRWGNQPVDRDTELLQAIEHLRKAGGMENVIKLIEQNVRAERRAYGGDDFGGFNRGDSLGGSNRNDDFSRLGGGGDNRGEDVLRLTNEVRTSMSDMQKTMKAMMEQLEQINRRVNKLEKK